MPNAPTRLINREGRNEFQILIAVMCVMSGVSQIVFNQVPTNMQEMSTGYQFIWSWSLLIGGVLIIASALWHDAEGTNRFIEMSGLIILGTVCLAYGVAVMLTSNDPKASFAGPLTMFVALACFSRTYRIARLIWGKKLTREDKIREEVKSQIAVQAEKEADRLIQMSKEDTGPLPTLPLVPPEESTSGDESESRGR
jgi:hypothetical protein